MFRNKKILSRFLSIIFLTIPFDALAQYSYPKDTGLPMGELADGSIIINIMNWLLGIVGVIGIIGFVISGILYFIAAGDDSKMGTAKNAMTYSIIGVIVALMGYVIIQEVEYLLS
ncbi:MAG: hypothetical protein UR66_C0009G0103 [Candidatus Moranbacteria bacterium GW2011_GWE1_35_17]|nr:MAG: hypothetical protein UR65_C0077G0009 [Candidatus Moranbacteria bacterium GW2011_GWE2_35_164]KKP68013.1 MAG: hypothetical protein UR66_C0009G0103 [Candidatus Moranbacteria bacterium GW2011_GWE1_35_17]KKP82305.1 MAG: hypothetical protein UR82_C0040G0014 [Candidatus Moranbacteria bacterium GW2011_GWF1_35_5]KKP82434.1 MAG: hypothetical protein UR83_C0052G0005 [Candidatus Moranbacteria bacterium GW2011_GWF2_35_54]